MKMGSLIEKYAVPRSEFTTWTVRDWWAKEYPGHALSVKEISRILPTMNLEVVDSPSPMKVYVWDGKVPLYVRKAVVRAE